MRQLRRYRASSISVPITFRGAWSGMARARRAQTLRVESGDRRGDGKHYAVRDVSETSAACVDLSTRWLQKET